MSTARATSVFPSSYKNMISSQSAHIYVFSYGCFLNTLYGLLTKCEDTMAGYWPNYFFSLFMDRDGVKVHKHAKKRTRPISSHLDQTSLVNEGFIIWLS